MRRGRLERLVRSMGELGLDQALITDDRNLYYYTGTEEESMERLRVLLVDLGGNCRYYANALFAPPGAGAVTVRHRDGEEGRALEDLARRLTPGGVLAVDQTWPSGYLLDLLALAPNHIFRSAGRLLSLPMVCKDGEEMELMRRSSQINDRVVEELISSISESSTEAGLSRSVHGLYSKHGAEGARGGALVAFGENCASPHPQAREVRPKAGDCILVDAGAPYRRYQSDMTRTVFFRDVSPEMERVYRTVLEANLAGIAAVRPGRTAKEIDRICRDVIEKSGYGPFFTHRTGHGIGLQLHEEPYLSETSDTVLREGMIFSIEPGIYLPQTGGVRVEDLVAVTANGAEVLNHLPKELRVIP